MGDFSKRGIFSTIFDPADIRGTRKGPKDMTDPAAEQARLNQQAQAVDEKKRLADAAAEDDAATRSGRRGRQSLLSSMGELGFAATTGT